MATPTSVRRTFVLFAMLATVPWLPAPAAAQDREPTGTPTVTPTADPSRSPAPADGSDEVAGASCTVTGYVVGSQDEMVELRSALQEGSVHQLGGLPLDGVDTWVLPDGGMPVVVVDSTEPLPGGETWLVLAGRRFLADSVEYPPGEEADRFSTNLVMPHLGPTVRTLGLEVDSGDCGTAVVLSVDRSVWSTLAGGVATGVSVLFGLLTVLVARRRKGGWLRRFLWAAPLGLLAGAGQAALLVEAGVVDPFSPFPWWPPAVGLAVAALLPLTRWRRAGAPAGEEWLPPVHAGLGRWRPTGGFARTALGEVHRAVAADGQERALVKVVPAPRAGEPGPRLALEREARLLADLTHPNLVRLREVLTPDGASSGGDASPGEGVPLAGSPPSGVDAPPGTPPVAGGVPLSGAPSPTGAPTLVFEDVDGAPLRQLAGTLSGPQAVTVVRGTLAGLAALHERELVHRDVGPDTIWIAGDGRVMLAGLELACPGVEHSIAPEPGRYPSPEQRAGQVLDQRSDLYACAALLRDLLSEPPPPLAQVLARALAEDREARPASAQQFADDLAQAAAEAYGPDWVGRGALAAALTAHGAIGAATVGYAAGGATGAAGAAAGAGAGSAGGGAAVAGLGAAAGASTTGVGSAVPAAGEVLAAAGPAAPVAGTSAAGTPVAGGAVVGATPSAGGAGAAAASGKVTTAVNVAVAALAGAVIGIGAVAVDPDLAEARELTITPDRARVIFIHTVAEARGEDFAHLGDDAESDFTGLMAVHDSLADAPLTEVGVGVPRDQYEYPAWFVAWATLPFAEGTASVFARFDRAGADEEWVMSSFRWSVERLLPAAVLDDEGWLVPPPALTDLLVDPESLPQRYRDWLARVNEANELVEDEVLALRFEDFGVIYDFTFEVPFYSGDNPTEVSYSYEMSVGEVVTDLIPLVDGTVHVTFTAIVSQTTYNTPYQRGAPCDQLSLHWLDHDPPGDFRWLSQDLVVSVDAWIPIAGAVPEGAPEGSAATPEPTEPAGDAGSDPEDDPEDQPPAELELAPVDPTHVVIEDWNFHRENRNGQPC